MNVYIARPKARHDQPNMTPRLIKAENRAQVNRHLAETSWTVDIAPTAEAVALATGHGVAIETAIGTQLTIAGVAT